MPAHIEHAEIETIVSPYHISSKRGPLINEDEISVRFSKKKRTVAVRFQEQTEVRKIPNRDDYSMEEKDATWYSKREMHRVRYEMIVSVRLLNNQRLATLIDSRGLEGMTQAGWESRNRHKRLVRNAVFVTQEEQRLNGHFDEDATRIASETVTMLPKVLSSENGTYDCQQALNVYKEDNVLMALLNRVQ